MEWKQKTHSLKYPVEHDGKKYTEATLREPDVTALEAIEDLGIEANKPIKVRQMRGILTALSDLPDAAVGKLHRDDLGSLGEIAAPLLEGGEASAPS